MSLNIRNITPLLLVLIFRWIQRVVLLVLILLLISVFISAWRDLFVDLAYAIILYGCIPLGSDLKITVVASVMNSKSQHFKINSVFGSVVFFTMWQFDVEGLANTFVCQLPSHGKFSCSKRKSISLMSVLNEDTHGLFYRRERLGKQAKRTLSYFYTRNKKMRNALGTESEIWDTQISKHAFKPYNNLDGKRMGADKERRGGGDEMKSGRKRARMKRNCNIHMNVCECVCIFIL